MLWVCYIFVYYLSPANRVRFGAVLEEFEVRDALESVFYTESDMTMY
jgi:hypothetical protein